MMIRFYRNTHRNGIYRDDLPEDTGETYARSGFLLHLLRHDLGATFTEVCQLVWSYEDDHGEDHMAIPDILEGLAEGIRLTVIASKQEEGTPTSKEDMQEPL